MSRRGGAFFVLIAVLASIAAGEAQFERPLTLDFLVRDRAGQPVTDLTALEVNLKIGGKARTLLSLELIAPADGSRDILLLVDEPTLFGLEPVAREALAALLGTLLPADRISYVTTRRPGQLSQRPGHASVLAGLEAMRTGPGDLWTCLSDMLRAVERAARLLPPGRGSLLAVLTRGALDDAEPIPSRSIGCTPGREDLRQTEQVVASTQVNLFIFAVNHLNRSWGLDTVAANTGGESGLLTWKDSGALARAATAARHFYRATFAADPSAPKLPQRVEVKVNRPNVKVITSRAIELRPRAH